MAVRDIEFSIRGKDRTQAAFDSAQRRAQAFGANADRAVAAADRGMVRLTQTTKGLTGQTGNLAAQFQDIAVQLQGGQSPFTIALQQGTQISAVLGPMGAGGAVRALGGAFASLLNPVSLATIGVIALGGAAFQYFSDMADSGEQTAEQLREQEALIKRVAESWGGALPALAAYNDELVRTNELQEMLKASEGLAVQQYDPLRQTLDELEVQFVDVISQLDMLGQRDENVNRLWEAFQNLDEKTAESKATAEDFTAVQEALAAVVGNGVNPSIIGLANSLDEAASAFANAAKQAAIFREQAAAAALARKLNETNPLGRLSPLRSAILPGASKGDFIDEQEYMNLLASRTKSQTQIAIERAEKRGKTKKKKKERDKYAEVIKKLDEESSMLGKNATAQRIMTEQRRAGVEATSAQGQAIADRIMILDLETERLKAIEQQTRALNASFDYLADSTFDTFWSMVDGSEKAEDALRKLGAQLLRASAQAVLLGRGPLAGLFGGGGGGFFASLFGGGRATASLGPSMASFLFPGRAAGGPVSPYQSYIVGERGPEILTMGGRGGRVASNAESFGQPQVLMGEIKVSVDGAGNVKAYVERMGLQASQRGAAQAVNVVRENFAAFSAHAQVVG